MKQADVSKQSTQDSYKTSNIISVMFREIINPMYWFRRSGSGAQDRKPCEGQDSHPESPDGPAFQSAGKIDATVKPYSRRMMPPFTGQLQIAESGDARALSIDGTTLYPILEMALDSRPDMRKPDKQTGKYTDVASITPTGLVRQPLHPIFDTETVTLAIEQLAVVG